MRSALLSAAVFQAANPVRYSASLVFFFENAILKPFRTERMRWRKEPKKVR